MELVDNNTLRDGIGRAFGSNDTGIISPIKACIQTIVRGAVKYLLRCCQDDTTDKTAELGRQGSRIGIECPNIKMQ